MPSEVFVKDLMVKEVVSATPDMPLLDASHLLFARHLTGLPVIDAERNVIGIVTEYDLLTKGTEVHLPTLLKLIKDIDLYKKDRVLLGDELKGVLTMTVNDVMNRDPLCIPQNAPVEDLMKAFAEHHRVNPIPVVDEKNKLIGVVSRHDLLQFYAQETVPSFRFVSSKRTLDTRIDDLVGALEHNFVMVSKVRTRFWLVFSLLFAIIGFAIAFALIVHVSVQW